MRLVKWIGGIFAIYVAFVVIFEGVYLRMFQPSFEGAGIPMVDLTSTDDNGDALTLRLALLELDGKLYVSAHHWTQGWYHRAVKYPNVSIEVDGETSKRTAVPVEGEEKTRVVEAFPLPLMVRFLMGFPPFRNILRLDPVESGLRELEVDLAA